jgi:ubiquinone/menaquinone biosynthesis C-methylase UbiE
MLCGFDVSEGMLSQLRSKFPQAKAKKLQGHFLSGIDCASIDLIISTLTIAHIDDLPSAFKEWDRVLKPGGELFITDYHPEALSRGADRSFSFQDRLIRVKNNIYPLKLISRISSQLAWQTCHFTEKKIDARLRPYYEKRNALKLFKQYEGVPIIYALHLKKGHEPA